MKKVLFVTNIPSPYRVDFYNQLGKFVDLTVIFEATGAKNLEELAFNGVAYGKFLAAVINFVCVAFVLFMLVKGINKFKKKGNILRNMLKKH